MKRLLLPILFLPLLANGQDQRARQFIDFLNDYHTDSLDAILADNFMMERTYSSVSNDKTSFLNNYVSSSKNCNAKFIIIKTLNAGNPVQFLAEDKSDYLKYLDIRPVLWKIIIHVNNDKIETMTVDTVPGISKDYFVMIRRKMKMFEDWLNKEYPGETNGRLYEEPGLLTRRLSEFAKLEDSH